ncbi:MULTISPECIES: hypothetical protein [unclassified Streptomyces]|uniref:hypothetical protein n=1 Tax=unclassified Streptomyces TaxID=2593676 RepID=UPI0004C1B1CE|nr:MULTISPECIES: hypothetical protein [unclassified Streptomyces]
MRTSARAAWRSCPHHFDRLALSGPHGRARTVGADLVGHRRGDLDLDLDGGADAVGDRAAVLVGALVGVLGEEPAGGACRGASRRQ